MIRQDDVPTASSDETGKYAWGLDPYVPSAR